MLDWGQEYRNHFPGGDWPCDFPLNTMAALEARKQGGLVTYVHPMGAQMWDVFDTSLGPRRSR